MSSVSRETEEVAVALFGDRLPLVRAYADWLTGPGIERGLLGPREADRIWDRHLFNCAVVTDVVPEGSTVCDVGSGAGLPGLVMALRRPDLRMTLVEPLLRRVTFLTECVADLGVDNVEIARSRAEDFRRTFDVVTSRAVAPLERLAGWSLPLTRGGGMFVPMKGSTAADELAAASVRLRKLGARSWSVLSVGTGVVEPPVTLLRIEKAGGRR